MKRIPRLQQIAVSLALVGICLPQVSFAAPPTPAAPPAITDVQLLEGNVFVGQVVTAENAPVTNTEVSLHSGDQLLATAKTDARGCFAFSGLQSGVYQVVTSEGHAAYRVWLPGTAPPSAQQGALVVTGSEAVRGQEGMRNVRNFLANPFVIAGIVACAVAIPVAIHNSHHGPHSP